ncbi:MAG TPA: orotidine-5'-phosphate decarboxylase [Chthoniobacterales bacterium]|nr:orotidine-5'-phosphate decarboxylase [Chthoniobacterales bacterium]
MTERENTKKRGERIIVALDFADPGEALDVVSDLAGEVTIFKVGLQLYTAAGPEIVRAIQNARAEVFLDLKLYDIPNTVARAVEAAAALGVRMLTVHLSGGRRMLAGAVASASPDLLLLGVSVLTSSDAETLRETGVQSEVEEQVVRLASLGAAAGIRGVVASPHEVRSLRREVSEKLIIVTPGVRPSWAVANDQKRVTTPREALDNGADYLVIGRPITAADDRREALRRIASELT